MAGGNALEGQRLAAAGKACVVVAVEVGSPEYYQLARTRAERYSAWADELHSKLIPPRS